MYIAQLADFRDLGDCYHRMFAPARAMSEAPDVWVVETCPHHRLFNEVALEADVFIIHPAQNFDLHTIIEKRRKAGKPTVMEVSDYYPGLHPWNQARRIWENRALRDFLVALCREVDAVQTTTPPLRRWIEEYYFPKVCRDFTNHMLPFPDPVPRPAGPPIVGLSGSVGHLGDWYAIADALAEWMNAHPQVQVHVMGSPEVKVFLPHHKLEFSNDYTSYLKFLDTITVGIAPLEATRYNQCRSDVKFLEFASRGVAGVFADYTPYDSVSNRITGVRYMGPKNLGDMLDFALANAQELSTNALHYVRDRRQLSKHIGARLDFYRILMSHKHSDAVPSDEVLRMASEVKGRHVRLKPESPEKSLEATLTPGNDPEVFMPEIEKTVRDYPAYTMAKVHYAGALIELEQAKKGVGILTGIIAEHPDSDDAYTARGLGHLHLSQTDKAAADLRKAIAINPVNRHARLLLVRALTKQGLEDTTLVLGNEQWFPSDYHLCLESLPLLPLSDRIDFLTRLLERLELTAEERPHASPPFESGIYKTLRARSDARALRVLALAVKLLPQSPRLAYLYATALKGNGQDAEARSHFQIATDLVTAFKTIGLSPPQDEVATLWKMALYP